MQITKEQAEEISDAWDRASLTERLRLRRASWYTWGDGDTKYFATTPSELELAAAARILALEATLRQIADGVVVGDECRRLAGIALGDQKQENSCVETD